jgi:hypothetical protein
MDPSKPDMRLPVVQLPAAADVEPKHDGWFGSGAVEKSDGGRQRQHCATP